jgi:hypothetical protein
VALSRLMEALPAPALLSLVRQATAPIVASESEEDIDRLTRDGVKTTREQRG